MQNTQGLVTSTPNFNVVLIVTVKMGFVRMSDCPGTMQILSGQPVKNIRDFPS